MWRSGVLGCPRRPRFEQDQSAHHRSGDAVGRQPCRRSLGRRRGWHIGPRITEQPMTTTLDDLLPTAKDLMKQLALAESEKAAESARRHAAEEAEKKSLMEHFLKPSGVSDQERMKRA